MSNRRKFLQQIGASAIMASALPLKGIASEEYVETRILAAEKSPSANDKINIACIGMGIMGFGCVETALKVPGVEFVAACDLYKGRLERAKEVFGKDIFTTRDYREILARRDVDAVIIATSDHWHDVISIDAMKAGKAVYCEKPMVQQIGQGLPVINTEKQTGAVYQVGSQRVSSVVFAKAKELYQAGEIGKLNCIEASFERQSALGAWEYTMPTDASEKTVDWKRYLKNYHGQPFDPKKFFWWRNYREFGTGIAGDLFVHLVSGIHFLTNSTGPSRIFSTGQLAYWKDGRDVPDVMAAIMQYDETPSHPAFQVLLKVNLISGAPKGSESKTIFYGSGGSINFGWDDFTLSRSKVAKAPGYGGWDAFNTYPEAEQKRIIEQYNKKYPASDSKPPQLKDIVFKAPAGYDDRLDHFVNFFESAKTKKPVIENATFGYRACAPCLACNKSYFEKKEIKWNAKEMRVV